MNKQKELDISLLQKSPRNPLCFDGHGVNQHDGKRIADIRRNFPGDAKGIELAEGYGWLLAAAPALLDEVERLRGILAGYYVLLHNTLAEQIEAGESLDAAGIVESLAELAVKDGHGTAKAAGNERDLLEEIRKVRKTAKKISEIIEQAADCEGSDDKIFGLLSDAQMMADILAQDPANA